jgi:hypothetical protein
MGREVTPLHYPETLSTPEMPKPRTRRGINDNLIPLGSDLRLAATASPQGQTQEL